MGPIETRLREKIETALSPSHLDLVNESHMHSVPKNSETHFRAIVVSDGFAGAARVARQRQVLDLVADEMKKGVHAFTLRCLTPEEFEKGGADGFISPACRGKGR